MERTKAGARAAQAGATAAQAGAKAAEAKATAAKAGATAAEARTTAAKAGATAAAAAPAAMTWWRLQHKQTYNSISPNARWGNQKGYTGHHQIPLLYGRIAAMQPGAKSCH